MISEQFLGTERSGILYDASILRKPAHDVFTREYWSARAALTEVAGGRGSVAFLRSEQGEWVLRHYRRGGWAAKFSGDAYLWTGAQRTRSFREWRLLAELYRRELPVPRPIGARFVREGLLYRADLITERLPDSRTLAASIAQGAVAREHWLAVGKAIATLHRNGVHHADLNAHNILLGDAVTSDGAPRVFVLDFDRGRLRARGAWEHRVLARLRRSLEKVRRQRPGVAFGDQEWTWLLEGYGGRGQGTGRRGRGIGDRGQ